MLPPILTPWSHSFDLERAGVHVDMPKMKIESHSQLVITAPENNTCSQTALRTFNNPFVFCFCQHWLFSPNAFYRLDVFIAHTWDWPTGHVHTTMHGGIWESPISVFSWRGWVSENDLVLGGAGGERQGAATRGGSLSCRISRLLTRPPHGARPELPPALPAPPPPAASRSPPARPAPPGASPRRGPAPPAPPARPTAPREGPPPAQPSRRRPQLPRPRRGGEEEDEDADVDEGRSVLRGTKRPLPFWDAAGPCGGSDGRARPLLRGCSLTFPVIHGGGGPCSPRRLATRRRLRLLSMAPSTTTRRGGTCARQRGHGVRRLARAPRHVGRPACRETRPGTGGGVAWSTGAGCPDGLRHEAGCAAAMLGLGRRHFAFWRRALLSLELLQNWQWRNCHSFTLLHTHAGALV